MAGAGLNPTEGLWGETAEDRLAVATLFSGIPCHIKLGTVLLYLEVNTGISKLKVKPKTWEK